MSWTPSAALAVASLALVVPLSGCAPTDDEKVVTVFAAASLTESFEAIADAFEAANPGIRVVLNFGGSAALAAQIAESAPADVFASASEETMTVGGSVPFATNTIEIAVPAGNPGSVVGLADFARPELTIALCAPEVPCGAVAAAALSAAAVVASIDSYEQDVKAVLTKIELGEVDAGLVYRTDVRAAGAAVVGIPVRDAPSTRYPIVALPGAQNPTTAAAFVAFVVSDAGQTILRKAGFNAP